MSSIPPLYVPCLRWKQGEYQALLQLSDDTAANILPLFEVAEIGWDFETRTFCKTVDAHLAQFARRVHEKWGRRPCYIDAKYIKEDQVMADGRDPASFIFDGLLQRRIPAIPVFDLRQGARRKEALKAAIAEERGMALRIRLEEAARADFSSTLDALVSDLGVSRRSCHLLLDLEAPNFKPLDGFAGLLEAVIAKLPRLEEWLQFAVIGTAFPSTMAAVARGLTTIERDEWNLYRLLASRLIARNVRVPAFGDYGIAHPDVLEIDPRFLKPAASVRYTVDDGWLIAKGLNVREHKFDQYRELCKLVAASGQFAGPDYSPADRYILDCAAGIASTGNLTTWRWVGTSHHLTKVTRDLSTLAGSSSSA